jgi:hypothetical protein
MGIIRSDRNSAAFAFNGTHRAVGEPTIRVTIQGHSNRKPALILPDNLDAGNAFAPGPLPDGIEAFFPQSGVTQAGSDEFSSHRHAQPPRTR